MPLAGNPRGFRLGAIALAAAAPLAIGTATSSASTGETIHAPVTLLPSSGERAGEELAARESPGEGAEEGSFELVSEGEGTGGEEEAGGNGSEAGEGSGEGAESTGDRESAGEEEEAESEQEEASASSRHSRRPRGVDLTGLRLTRATTSALDHGHVRASGVSFTFRMSASAKVRVTLDRKAGSRGGSRWTALPDPVTLRATRGLNRGHLDARYRLAPGGYRVTLTPAHGSSRSLALRVR